MHEVDVERHPTWPGYRRWRCTCGWHTDWDMYTSGGPAAVLHQIHHHKEDTDG